MKNKNTFLFIITALLFSPLLALAQTWVGPTATAPGSNAATPINTSATSQTKAGALIVSGGVSAASLSVTGGSSLAGTVTDTAGGFYYGPTTGIAYNLNAPGTSYLGIGSVLATAGKSAIVLGHSSAPFGTLVPDMTVTESGLVGIGTTNPGSILDIESTGNTIVRDFGADTGQSGYSLGAAQTNRWTIFQDAAGSGRTLRFYQDHSGVAGVTGDAMTITTAGAVSIPNTLSVTGIITGSQYCIGASCISSWPSGGAGTITGVTAGTDMSGGGTTGTVTLNNTATLATVTGRGATTASALTLNGTVQMGTGTNFNINGGTTYGMRGNNGYFDTINTGTTNDPLEINYAVAGPTKICSAVNCTSYSALFDQSNNVTFPGTITAGAITSNGALTFSQANPTISASSYFVAPGGAYFSSGTVYFQTQLQARGGVHDDTNTNLTLYGGTSGNTVINNTLFTSYIGRQTHSTGYLVGSYNSVGANDSKTNPIYTIGSSYEPSDTSLGSMYGIGFSHSNFWGGKSSGWGLYQASGGTIYNTMSDGGIWTAGTVGIGMVAAYPLDVNGTIEATAFLYASDERLKKNIESLSSSDSLAKIMQLNPVSFNWKDTSKGTQTNIGLIAQQVEKVYPELVSTASTTGIKSVEYGNLVSPLISAMQEQQKEIEALKAEVKALESK